MTHVIYRIGWTCRMTGMQGVHKLDHYDSEDEAIRDATKHNQMYPHISHNVLKFTYSETVLPNVLP
jgi:hypothetical protein